MNHYPPKDGSRTSSEQEKAAGDPALRETGVRPETDPNHGHNFLMAIVYQCCLRVGWIFKTESIIMPAVLDVIGGSGWLRGCLPMLNRFGNRSVPHRVPASSREAPNDFQNGQQSIPMEC